MNDKSEPPSPSETPATANDRRRDRLRQALRENLKRRKSQARGRDGHAAAAEAGPDAPRPDAGKSSDDAN